MRISLLAAAAIVMLAGCKPFQMGTASVTPVKTGVEYELVTTTASKAHSRPIIFGVVFGEERSFMEVMADVQKNSGCAVMKKVEMAQVAITYLGFGQQTTSVKGECYKVKGT